MIGDYYTSEIIMSKLVPPADLGVPVLSPAPAPGTMFLVVYYGVTGWTPSYSTPAPTSAAPSPGRIVVGDVTTLAQKTEVPPGGTVSGTFYDDPIGSELPAGMVGGSYDFYFTYMDANGNESDFSAKVTAVVDTTVPPTPGQPVRL